MSQQEYIKGKSLWSDAVTKLRKNRLAVISFWIILFYCAVCVLAPVLPLHSYSTQVIEHAVLPPSFKPAKDVIVENKESQLLHIARTRLDRDTLTEEMAAELEDTRVEVAEGIAESPEIYNNVYLLGTDDLGRDILARTIYGAQISIAIGLVGAVLSVIVGMVVGAFSGYIGGKTDFFIMRFVDVMYGLPYMMIVIILMAVFPKSIMTLFVALSLISWLTTARVVRGQILSLKNSLFVEAARSMGASRRRIIFRHMIPNCFGIIIVYTTLRVPQFIMMESFLSFLGLGVSAPYASWGTLISDGTTSMASNPWRLLVPAVAMSVFLFAMNFLGDGLRDALDPKKRRD